MPLSPRAPLLVLASVLLACTASDKGATAASEADSTGNATTTAGSSSSDPTTTNLTTTNPTTTDPATTNPGTTTTATAPTTDDPPATDTGDDPPATTTGAPAVSFTEVYEQVIMVHGCNAGYCHGGSAGGLEMTDEATSYANLVEVKAATALCDQSMRVVPGAPDESILWYRVRPPAEDAMNPCAKDHKMPKIGDGLDDTQAQLVRDWIAGGALE